MAAEYQEKLKPVHCIERTLASQNTGHPVPQPIARMGKIIKNVTALFSASDYKKSVNED
jgi:hypothetical protein